MTVRKFPLIPDFYDGRDYIFKSASVAPTLPEEVDLRSKQVPVVDQLSLGSCSSNMTAGLGGYIQVVHHEPVVPLSRLHHYWHERELEGTIPYDAGATLRSAMKVFQTIGMATEATWAYDPERFTVAPSAEAEATAKDHMIKEYHRVLSFADMKAALAQGCPVAIGMRIFGSFDTASTRLTGVIPVPDTTREPLLGGHALLVVGYKRMSNGTTYAITRNSWGTEWGMQGYCLIPEDYWTAGHVFDMWTTYDATPSGAMTYEQAVKILGDKGIFDSPDFWLNLGDKYEGDVSSDFRFLRLAFIKIATYVQNK